MRFNPFVCTLLLGAQLLSSPSLSQDVSPDNMQAALPWNGQLQLLNLQNGGLTPVKQGEEASKAQWSPNGRYLVWMSGRGDTSIRLFDTRTGSTRILGNNLSFPVAWREDSVRLAMFYTPPSGRNELIQYGVVEKGINLRVNIGVMPNAGAAMVWLPGTDNVAFVGRDGNVYSVEEAEIKKVTTSNDVIGMELSGDKKSLVWARRGPNPKYILVTFYSYDLTSRSVRRIDFPGNIEGINPNPRRAPLAVESAVFAPSGRWVALTVTEELSVKPPVPPKSSPGGKQKSGGKAAAPVPETKPATVRRKVVYAVRMDGSGAAPAVATAVGANITPFWSRDGSALYALVTNPPASSLVTRNVETGIGRTVLGGGQ